MVRETRHLWVGNLPNTIREERILDHFKRYGKVQSVKILPKKEEESGTCATVAFIDLKSAAKAHNADNKIDDRTLKTDYYEPPASSTASSAIYIHERDDALVRPATAPYAAGRTPRYGLPEDRNYERPGHYYERVAEREPYLRRPIGMGYHDEDNYQVRAKSRDRYSRSTPGNNYTDGTERNQNHFRTHNARQHFEQPRYPAGDQYNDERDAVTATTRLNRRTNNTPATPAIITSVASPTPARSESRPRRTKRRSPSRTPSGSRSNSGSRSRSRSTSGSRSSSSSSKLRSSSSDSSGRSLSPSKSRSPAASFGSQSNAKGSRLDRPSSAIANPSSTVCFLPSAVNTSAINCTSNLSQVCIPTQGCVIATVENHSDKEEKRPLGICVRNLPVRSTDTSLKDGLFHEYKKHGKVTIVKVIGQGTDRYAVVCFKKPEDVDKALEVSKDKLFFGCKIEVTAHEGLDAEDNEFRPLEAELDEFHPKATRTLFIGNLEKDITTAELRKHFDQFGEIIEIDIKKQGSATSYAFIQYSDIASVVKAMRKLDGENLGANRIKLGFGKSMPTNCVWLDGIVDTVSEKFLARHFSRFGIVAYTAVDREKGHALVFYESVEFAQIAVSEMRGRILGGKKLQVDFASRECQTTFFDKLEMTGQMVPGDGTRPWERRERRAAEFEVVRNDEREPRVGFENRVYPRFEGQARPPRGNFRGGQRAGFSARGRGQGFPQRYEVFQDEFGERRHRYNSRDESGGENSSFEGKVERPKYGETAECPNRKRNKLRNSISDQESHHSQSPPRSRHHSRSTSPVLKERKPAKERLHHRVKSPGSQSSSLVNSPSRDGASDDMDLNSEYTRDFRVKGPDLKIELNDVMTDLSFSHVSPRSGSEKDLTEKSQSKSECDSVRSRSLDAESPDEAVMTNDQLSQLERKKRFLATTSNLKGGKELNSVTKLLPEKVKLKSPVSNPNTAKVNCVSDNPLEVIKSDLESGAVPQEDCAKDKPHQTEGSSTDLKYLQKKQVHILQLLEQLREGVNPSDAEVALEYEQLARKKNRSSSSCIETYDDDDISKSLTKEECAAKLLKAGLKDPTILARMKTKADNADGNNCIAISLDSFIFRKHLDPRKGFDQHAVSLASVNSLQKCRRISVDNDLCLPNSQGNSDSFICVPTSITSDVSWKKQCGSLNDLRFSDNDVEDSISATQYKVKDDSMFDNDILSKKTFTPNSSSLPLELQKSFVTLRTFADNLPCHEIKRERDSSPLSLPLPKFAASLRSPKSSPSTLTSPKSSTAHSPRAGQSPSSYVSIKSIRIPELLQEMPNDKKAKDGLLDEKVNGASIFPFNSISPFESHSVSETSESTPCMEPIQSPKNNCEKTKESNCSSESDFSPASSPNRPSIEDRIKALDEKFNAWSGSTRGPNSTAPDASPVAAAAAAPVTIDVPKSQVKRSRFNFLAPDVKSEPSDIVKSLLAKSTIFDQDSKRLQHIDEKYEPLNVKADLSPKVKPAFRTKAAAKEFSTPIAPAIQPFNQTTSSKSPSVLVAQGIMSPPTTPLSAPTSILSPVTPPLAPYTQLPPQLFTPCSPRSTTFSVPTALLKNVDSLKEEKDLSDHVLNPCHMFNSVKPKTELGYMAAGLSVSKSMTSACHVEMSTHGLKVSSPPIIKKEPLSPPCGVVQSLCKVELENKISVKKEITTMQSSNIPTKKDSVSLVKEQSLSKHFNSVDAERKDFCDSKDPRLAHSDSTSHCRETGFREAAKTHVDSCAKSQIITTGSDMTDPSTQPAAKKRVSSIDSNESDSSKSQKSLESSRDSQETNWSKHEKYDKNFEPEPKRPKLSKISRERSHSPNHHSVKKSEKKEKCTKPDRPRSSSSKPDEKDHHDSKCNNKNESKEKSSSDHKHKDEKRSKSRDSKESSSKNEQRTKSRERRNSEKDGKSGHNNSKSKKEGSSSKSEKTEKPKSDKKSEKKSGSSKSKSKNEFSFFIEEEPTYFSMYDKVKARSSKTQVFKNQAKDMESMRQKFSKLKQSRAKREEKSKSIDQDSDNDSASHHSSESDSQTISSSTKSSIKLKQQRKRKLVIESSSSDDGNTPRDRSSRISKSEKDFSDSGTDSDFEFNVSQRQSNSSQCNRNRKKKTDLLESDSSDSDAQFQARLQSPIKKKTHQYRPKHKIEKSKKIIKSDEDMSDVDNASKPQNKEKDHKTKKIRKEKSHELKSENDMIESDASRKPDDPKSSKKKTSKESKQDETSDVFSSQKKHKSELKETKDKISSSKERKGNTSIDKMSIDESEKHKNYSKKRKKSKKVSRNKEKRMSSDNKDSRKFHDESDNKCLPVLLSPKPSSPTRDKLLSPPHLQADILSDNDFKSDFSDFDFESHEADDLTPSLWNQIDTKTDTNPNKYTKNKKKETGISSKSHSESVHSPEQDCSLPSFFDKLSDVTDSETGHEPTDRPISCDKKHSFSYKKESVPDGSPRKSKHDKHDDHSRHDKHEDHSRHDKHDDHSRHDKHDDHSRHESTKHCDTFSSSSREEKRKKKYKKQSKERKKKVKEDNFLVNATNPISIESPPSMHFDSQPLDEDSRLSDIQLDDDIAEEARRLEQELLAPSEETNTFGEEGPAKREEKLLERRFEEEAAKETRRLEAELFSTGRESWHMKDKEYDSEVHSEEMCADKHDSEIESMVAKDENLFAALELHSSITETSQNEADVFLSAHSESDQYKLEDKDVSNDIEDQRKIEDDLAVSALLQEMHCGEISAPELTKETDYLDPLMDNHPEDTMNYLLPDEGENSLHIADNSPDMQGSESQEAKLESSVMLLSPSSNSEPPSLEISTVEDSVLMKLENLAQSCHPENLKLPQETETNSDNYHSNTFDFTGENSLEACESKPPVIDIPAVTDVIEHAKDSISPKLDSKKLLKKKQREKSKADGHCRTSEDTDDDEASSDLADNQLSHFEDITMDNTDSKDDDNPPILLPVESPRNLLPITMPKEKTCMEPLVKLDNEVNPLDSIIDKVPSSESLFDKVSDLDKQIGDIINSITELSKQTLENSNMRTTDSGDRSPIPLHIPDFSDHNSSDSLLTSNPRLFSNTKQDDLLSNPNKFNQSLLDGPKEASLSEVISLPINEMTNDKFKISEQVTSNCNVDTHLSFYSKIIKSSCETSVIQSLCTNENDKISVSKVEKPNFLNNDAVSEQSKLLSSVSELNQVTDNSFILDMLKTREEKEPIPTNKFIINDPLHNICDSADLKTDISCKDSFSDVSLKHNKQKITAPVFEIPEVNEQNEATEFNQEIFEHPSEQSKESNLPCLLSFSSEQLFPDCTINKSPEKKTGNPSSNLSEPIENYNELKNGEDLPVADKNPFVPLTSVDCHLADNPSDCLNEDSKNTEKINLSIDEKMDIEDALDSKSRQGDLESVCSDTTDITIPDTKAETETNNLTSSEEQVHDDICPADEFVLNPKPKTRKGRRGKGRKHAEPVSQKNDTPPQEVVPNQIHVRNPGRRLRPASSERTRRSLRSYTAEATVNKEMQSIQEGRSDDTVETENTKVEEIADAVDTLTAETDCSNASHGDGDKKQQPKEEPRKRRGRKKKSTGDQNQAALFSEKTDLKVDDVEQLKDFHRPKEPRFLLKKSSEKEQKASKDTSSAYDVFEFRGSDEDEAPTFESVKERLHDSNRVAPVSEQKHDIKVNEVVPEKDKKHEDIKLKSSSTEEREVVKDHKVETNHHRKVISTEERETFKDHKAETNHHRKLVSTEERETVKEHKVETNHKKQIISEERETLKDHKFETNHHKKEISCEERETVKDHKAETNPHRKQAVCEEKEATKDHKVETNPHRKLSMIIRWQKDGHDGTSPATAEVVTLNIEEKVDNTKSERVSSKQDSTPAEVPYNGPCKSTRKSTRLMNQASRSTTLDEIIEDVVKGKVTSTVVSEPIQTRATRRSRSSRRSEESLTIIPNESSEDVVEDKNKNKPVFYIMDNAVKDVPEDTKPNNSVDSSLAVTTTSESDKAPDNTHSLRLFRLTRSTASKLGSNKDNHSLSAVEDQDSQKTEVSHNGEEKSERKESVKDTKLPLTTIQDNAVTFRSQPSVSKDLLKKFQGGAKETITKSEKPVEPEEDSDSRSSPVALIDPVTGHITVVEKGADSASSNPTRPNVEAKSKTEFVPDLTGISTSVLNIKIPQLSAAADLTTISTVNQASGKPNPTSTNDTAHIGQTPLIPNRTKQSNPSQPAIIVQGGPSLSDSNSNPHNPIDKSIDQQLPLPAKKTHTSAPVGVVTIASSAASVTCTATTALTTPTTSIPATTTASPIVSPVVSTVHGGLPVSIPVSVPILPPVESDDTLESANDIAAPKSTLMSVVKQTHSYQSPVRTIVTAVVTATSGTHSPSLPLTVQAKCSASATVVPPVVSKSEVPFNATNVQTSHIEHTSSINCKPAIITTAISPDLPNVVGKYDVHAVTSANTPLTSTWSNSKISSGNRVVVPTDAHVSIIQNISSHLISTSKSDLRSRTSKSPHVHVSKNNSAYSQQPGFAVSGYETAVLQSAHGLASAPVGGGVIAEYLQNPQLLQQHKEYFAAASSGQLQERIQVRPATPVASVIHPDIASRHLGTPTPTPPHTPTPPVTASNHNLMQSEMHPAHVNAGPHMRPSQSPLIVPSHSTLHHPELNAYVRQQIIYASSHPHFAANFSDLRAQQEAQARAAAAISMNTRFAYPLPHAAMTANSFRQPSERRSSAAMDAKSDQKMHEIRDDKSHHSMKSNRIKKDDKELKFMHSDCRDELESGRHASAHDKITSNAATHNVSLRQQQHHYSSAIRQLSPHDRTTDSPKMTNHYATAQNRVSQISIGGQMEDHKVEGNKMPQAHHYKGDLNDRELKQPPIAHQSQPSTTSYHMLEAAVHQASRQQLLGVNPIGSPSTVHMDGRVANLSHSPGSHGYKKDSNHSQQVVSSMHTPASDKRLNSDPSNKVSHIRTLSHQGLSISSGAIGLANAHSPLWSSVMQSHHPDAQSPHIIMPPGEQSSHRPSSSHHTPQLGSEHHAPPPAHAMSQPTGVPRALSQTPPHVSQVPPHGDSFIMQRYPVMWQGLLALKNEQAAVQMHFVSGNPNIAKASLPAMIDGETAPVKISQRMRLEQTQLEGVARKMQMMEEHCILMALPCGMHHMDVLQQSSNLKSGFINYLQLKQAAGIVNAALPGTQQPVYVIHIFPSCEFSDMSLARFAPDLLHIICDIAHLVIIIATV